MPPEEEDVVVASPTLVKTGPEPSPRLEVARFVNVMLAEDGVSAIGPAGASGSVAQPRH